MAEKFPIFHTFKGKKQRSPAPTTYIYYVTVFIVFLNVTLQFDDFLASSNFLSLHIPSIYQKALLRVMNQDNFEYLGKHEYPYVSFN